MNRILSMFLKFSHKYSYLLLVVFIMIFALELFYIKENFKLNTELKALFEGSNETVQDLQKLSKMIGSVEEVMVVSKSDVPENNIKFLTKLQEKVKTSPMVRAVDFERDIKYLEDRALLFLPVDELTDLHKKINDHIKKKVSKELDLGLDDDEESEEKAAAEETEAKNDDEKITELINSLDERITSEKEKYNIAKYYSTNDGTYTLLKVKLAGSATNITTTKKLTAFIEGEIAKLNPSSYGVEVEVGGKYRHKIKEIKTIYNDLYSTLGICIFLLAFTIMFYFRWSISSLPIILLPLSAGVLSAIFTTLLIIDEFNIISAFSFVVLYGLGIDFGIHLLSRYGEEKDKRDSAIEAMMETYKHTVPAITSGAVTTMIAFSTLILLDFKGFSDYGIVAVIGILTSLLSFFLFFPLFIFSIEKIVPLKLRPRRVNFLETLYNLFDKPKKIVLAVVAAVTLLVIISLMNVPIEYNLNNLSYPKKEHPDSLVYQYNKAPKRKALSRQMPSVILTNSLEETKAVTRRLDEIREKKPFRHKISSYLSLFNFIPDDQADKLRKIRRIKRLIERKINLFNEKDKKSLEEKIIPLLSVNDSIKKEKLPGWILEQLKDSDGEIGRFVVLRLFGSKNNIISVREIKEDYGVIKTEGKEHKMIATYLLLADIYDVIHSDVPRSIFMALIAVFLTLLITFKSGVRALFLVIPLSIGFLWMFGIAYVFDIKFNLFNMVIIPTIVGMGIDSSIHIFHRYIKEKKIEKMPDILKYTGGAVFFSSLTTMVGFSSLIFSSHRGLKSIGLIASIGIVTVTVANIIVFPLIIKFVADKGWGIRKKER